jgi:hypothetical protein
MGRLQCRGSSATVKARTSGLALTALDATPIKAHRLTAYAVNRGSPDTSARDARRGRISECEGVAFTVGVLPKVKAFPSG